MANTKIEEERAAHGRGKEKFMNLGRRSVS